MRTVFFSIILSLILVATYGLNKSGARVALVESRQQQNDEFLTGTYEGYKNQTINMLLIDGTRRAYPFKSDKSLLGRISKTPLSTRVTITVENGVVVRFEEIHK
ncbi:MAG: hypothetical protein PHH28_02625 [Desulfuromonadaceae bacterium]|nr:hypothetical protein [Desulfuromonadaceae bacterium]